MPKYRHPQASVTPTGPHRHTSFLLLVVLEPGSPAWEKGVLIRRLKLLPLASVANAPLEILGVRFTCTAPTRWPQLHKQYHQTQILLLQAMAPDATMACLHRKMLRLNGRKEYPSASQQDAKLTEDWRNWCGWSSFSSRLGPETK